MTKTNEDIQKFIVLRASGLSYDKIAQEMDTSKPTLLKWAKEFQRELDEAQFFELQDIMSQYGIMRRSRVEVLSESLQVGLLELRSRMQAGKLSELPTDKLLNLVLTLEARLERETGSRRLEFSDSRNLDYAIGAFVDVD